MLYFSFNSRQLIALENYYRNSQNLKEGFDLKRIWHTPFQNFVIHLSPTENFDGFIFRNFLCNWSIKIELSNANFGFFSQNCFLTIIRQVFDLLFICKRCILTVMLSERLTVCESVNLFVIFTILKSNGDPPTWFSDDLWPVSWII